MAGLFDFLGSDSGGGLLDFLRNNAMNQQFSSGRPEDQAQYGAPPQSGNPMDAMARMRTPPPVAAPLSPELQQQAAPPQQRGPDIGNNLMAGFQSWANTQPGNIFGGIANGIAGLTTGQRQDPVGVAQQSQNMTYRALVQKGIDPATAQAAVGNPEVLSAIVKQIWKPEQNDNFSIVQSGEDGLGRKTYVKLNKSTGEQVPVGAPQSDSGGGLGDMNKSGPEYLATLPKQLQLTVSGVLNGTVQPPSSFAAAKPYWQGVIAAAKNVDPSFDENNWASRRKMSTDMAASGNSSMGGILSNGKSAFKHLAEYTASAADLGNTSHDFPLGGLIAHGQNALGNTLGGSGTNAKIKAINDNLGHYGQESTKFYAGTGGGVEERMNALKEMNPTYTSSAEMAAYAAKEKGLMLDRLREKEAQIRDTMGEAYLQKHPVFTPELQNDIARIDKNVKKLRGEQSAADSGGTAKPKTVVQNGHSYTLQSDGSYK